MNQAQFGAIMGTVYMVLSSVQKNELGFWLFMVFSVFWHLWALYFAVTGADEE